jgi:hypothetical protein
MGHSAPPIHYPAATMPLQNCVCCRGQLCCEDELAVGANAEGKAIDPVALVLLTGARIVEGAKNETCVF